MNKNISNKISTDEESEGSIDCSCEILNDTSLEDVGDSDCSCSECLEANLNAFNELKELEELENLSETRSLGKKTTRKEKKREDEKHRQKTTNGLNRNQYSSVNKLSKYGVESQNEEELPRMNKFTRENINDFIMITRERTRQYLNERNKLENQNQKLKDELKSKIKQNLQILKYTVKSINEKDQNEGKQPFEDIHPHKWNHTPAVSREIEQIRQMKNECKSKLKQRQKERKKIDTNLENILPEFSSNPSEFLEEAKLKRLEKFKECKGCPYDHCPNHHMRTSNQKLQEIEQFILKKTKEYMEKVKNEKKTKEENEKIRQAKLRAIEIKSKHALKRSKKYDPSESRSSFHLTIDHFSTFSELKANKQEKDEEKQHREEVKKMMKEKGGKWEQAIYEDEFENEPPIESNVKHYKKIEPITSSKKEYCEKITKEAKIYSPRQVKPEDEKYLKEKKEKKKKTMNSNEEKNKAKQITLEIERKKHELMEEYKKQQQLKESKNEKVKSKFEESLKRVKS